MRPALLRLLKRPSAVSILDTLASTPVGIEQLESRYTCIRCQSHDTHTTLSLDDPEHSSTGTESRVTQRMRSPFSFPIYEIEPPKAHRSAKSHPTARNPGHSDTAQSSTKALSLSPEKLEFESDVGHCDDIGTRLVDHPASRNNFDLWAELLRFRQRHYGDQGTLDIWEGLTVRLDDVHLPTTGELADFFWRSFVDLGLKRELFLRDVMDYADDLWESKGVRWPWLYESVVGGLLDRGMRKRAVEWHKRLQHPHLTHANDIFRVLQSAICPKHLPTNTSLQYLIDARQQSLSPGAKAFKDMCCTIDDHRIYNRVISILLQNRYGHEALTLHKFLVGRGDHPQIPEEIQPLLDYAKKYGTEEEFEEVQAYYEKRFEPEPEEPVDQEKSDADDSVDESDQEPTEETLLEETPFKDDIGARLFATPALNFEMIVAGLKMLGVTALGPRMFREMAVRAHGGQDILEKLKVLQQSGISAGDSVCSRLVRKLAVQHRDILLSDILNSDLHPDVFEDVHMQESLLIGYYMSRDWRQYNMCLAILTEISSDTSDLANIHFRKHITARELQGASKVVDDLTLRGKTLTEESIDFMAEKIFTPREVGHAPHLAGSSGMSIADEVMFVFRVLQRLVPVGAYVSAEFWAEILKRLGMGNHWDELRECCHWLVLQYRNIPEQRGKAWDRSPSRSTLHPHTLTATNRDGRMLDLIFTPTMQCAVVSWGFKLRVVNDTESTACIPHPVTGHRLVPWVRGILLLREMEQAGLRLHVPQIRRATRYRLVMLFGDYCPSIRPINRMVRRMNPYNPSRVAGDILRVWGQPPLFSESEILDWDGLVNPSQSRRSLHRSMKVRTSSRRH
ncbi:hypothetical protein NUU61_002577 [Penicillium alfredii]|uniref:Pentatricopeptide repeat domain-containing protein n=1 Tax=Penicillium alfredii TaxID=1506179 RepID=A0A9W9FSH9_9EURO|nr:uncharacterized protein NUU61_002577 [Penicillium alfredii]KAJ5105230.1 hypothetical protein NUU61_002577 [Penicillium alfredii]